MSSRRIALLLLMLLPALAVAECPDEYKGNTCVEQSCRTINNDVWPCRCGNYCVKPAEGPNPGAIVAVVIVLILVICCFPACVHRNFMGQTRDTCTGAVICLALGLCSYIAYVRATVDSYGASSSQPAHPPQQQHSSDTHKKTTEHSHGSSRTRSRSQSRRSNGGSSRREDRRRSRSSSSRVPRTSSAVEMHEVRVDVGERREGEPRRQSLREKYEGERRHSRREPRGGMATAN